MALCVAYYFYFSEQLQVNVLDAEGLFQYALNSHDHFVYLDTIKEISSGGIEFGLNNDVGITIIYMVLARMFPWLADSDYVFCHWFLIAF